MKRPSFRPFISYRGPSLIDGAPIVVVVNKSKPQGGNRKTGAMIQTWILRADMLPARAARIGADSSICGDCKHRGTYRVYRGKLVRNPRSRSCYVHLGQAPTGVYKAFKRNSYLDLSNDMQAASRMAAGCKVRLGSYGDPAAVPVIVWHALLAMAIGHTGYTHQWQAFPELSEFCMASVDTMQERVVASALGFRTFRVAPSEGWTREQGEGLCPASEQAGKRTTCIACTACDGNARMVSDKLRASIMIPAHGGGKRLITA